MKTPGSHQPGPRSNKLSYDDCMQLGRFTLVIAFLLSVGADGANWPTWRGPTANGISDEKNLPQKWGPEENIAWRVPLPGVGTSSPIVWGEQVFLTMQVGKNPVDGIGGSPEGPTAREAPNAGAKVQFLVRSHSVTDGGKLWDYRFDAEGLLPSTHRKHNLASPSCTTDGDMVYAWMGTGQLVALTMDGKLVWSRHIGREYAPFGIRWGHGSSPVLYQGILFLLCDHVDEAYLLALDKRTGKELWKVDRGTARSYMTPHVVRGEPGDELVISSTNRIDAYDPKTGKLLWHADEPVRVPVASPVLHDGVLYTSRGYRSGPYLAIKTGGRGDVSDSHVIWRVRTGAPYISSLLYYQGLIYMSTEAGVVTCVDAADGKTLWKERLGGYFSASPVAAAGKVYVTNEEGETFILAAGREYRLLGKNDIGERTLASPAVASGGRILLRTDEHLISIGKRGE